MSYKPFDLQALYRFRTPGLDIKPELLGATHQFHIDGHLVQIALPKLKVVEDKDVLDLHCWQEIDGVRIPIEYSVGEIEVIVSIQNVKMLPILILEQRTNAYELVPSDLQDELRSTASSHTQLAERAVNIWARTLRWKTGNGRIVRGEFEGFDTGSGVTLIDAATKKRLWVHHEPIIIEVSAPVEDIQWNKAGISLAAGEEPPVFIDIFFDAEMHLMADDLRRALVDAAVSAETYIRYIVQEALPSDLGQSAKELIDKTGIAQLMEKIFSEALAQLGKSDIDKDTKAKIRELFKARNLAVHKGKLENVDKDTCSKYINAVRSLIGSSFDS
jgi:hypothetical protein